LKPSGVLRFALTVTNGGKARKAHQTFVTISDATSGLQESYPMTVNDKGKAKLDIVRHSRHSMQIPGTRLTTGRNTPTFHPPS